MQPKNSIQWVLTLALLASLLLPAGGAGAFQPLAGSPPLAKVSAYELILAMNTLRVSSGLPALIEDPIINAVAQSTAEIMAANQMSSHIGDVRGRLQSAGYGGGAQVWATENFAVGDMSIDEIMVVWSDASHMIPAVNPAYCHVGAGVATSSNGRTYYVLQAAYTSAQSCGEYKAPDGQANKPGGGVNSGGVIVPQIIIPVKVATPDAEGKVFHEVKAGQSFWSIAIAYKITIRDIETWNNISRDSKLQVGQKLFIPTSNTEGYATPTPVGMIQIATPDANGKIIHSVQPYNTLITIAEAYKISVDALLAQNGIQKDWPLQIGQKLVVNPGASTPTPTPLSPIEVLTPDSEGNYYHIVQSGESLLWIAGLYDISVNDLMAWNGISASDILYPDQKLLLLVTPPPTQTPTPEPPTATLTATLAPPTPSGTPAPVQAAMSSSGAPAPAAADRSNNWILFLAIALAASGVTLAVLTSRKRK